MAIVRMAILRRRRSVYVHDGQALYARTGVNSQKALNICQHDEVSLAITPAYQDWQHIRSLFMAGRLPWSTTPTKPSRWPT
jgi:hypothetical protein